MPAEDPWGQWPVGSVIGHSPPVHHQHQMGGVGLSSWQKVSLVDASGLLGAGTVRYSATHSSDSGKVCAGSRLLVFLSRC